LRPVDIHCPVIHVFADRICPRVLEYSIPYTKSCRASVQLYREYTWHTIHMTHRRIYELYSRFWTYTGAPYMTASVRFLLFARREHTYMYAWTVARRSPPNRY
jgi:hypothetical protein